jgi:hypothetical protein
VVLGGHTKVAHPRENFQDSFKGTTGIGYGLSNALVKVNFAYYGYTNAFNVVNEVKVRTPQQRLTEIFYSNQTEPYQNPKAHRPRLPPCGSPSLFTL